MTPEWFDIKKEMPLEDEIICYPEMIDGYRNKVEFSVGRPYAPPQDDSLNKDGQPLLFDENAPICVGFNRGNLSKGL